MAMTTADLLLSLSLFALQGKADDMDPKEALRGLWNPITLAVKDTSARVVLEQVLEQSGQKLTLPEDWQPKDISLNLKGATFWQAVDEICRLDGQIGLPSTGSRHRHDLVVGPSTGRPVAYAGPLRFSIDDVARIRELRYPNRTDRTELAILVQWTDKFVPVLDPWPYPGTVEVVRAESGARSLLPPAIVEENFIRSAGGTSNRTSMWLLRLQPADRADKEIARLDIVWKTVFPVEVEEVVFDTPLESVGVTRRLGPFVVTLESCKRDPRGGSGLETTLILQADVSNVPPETLRSLQAVPLERRVMNEVEVDGQKDRNIFKVVEGTREPHKVTVRTWLSGNRDPQTITFHVAKRAILLAIPLSFANIRLPEEQR